MSDKTSIVLRARDGSWTQIDCEVRNDWLGGNVVQYIADLSAEDIEQVRDWCESMLEKPRG